MSDALKRIAAAVEANGHHPADDIHEKEEGSGKPMNTHGLTEVAAEDVVDAGKDCTDETVKELVAGARGALVGRRKGLPPLAVFQKTHQLRKLVELATPKTETPVTTEAANGTAQ